MSLKQKQAEAYAQKLKRFFMTLDASGRADYIRIVAYY